MQAMPQIAHGRIQGTSGHRSARLGSPDNVARLGREYREIRGSGRTLDACPESALLGPHPERVQDLDRDLAPWRTMLHFRNRMNKIWPENMIVIGVGA